MAVLTRWFDDPALDAVWGDRCDYLALLAALNDTRLAAVLRDEDEQELVVIDAEGLDAWLASYDRAAYDETTEVA